MLDYTAPVWLPGGHAQTIWPALSSRLPWRADASYTRERIDTPDGDFIDFDFGRAGDPGAPLLVLFHGLEGSSSSHYALAFARLARQRRWSFVVPHFRGCSGSINRAPRAYHSGDYEEIGWMLDTLHARQRAPLLAVGISLGGNALLRWAAEAGAEAARTTRAVAAVCAPIDLGASGQAIDRGFNRLVYARNFLRSMKPRALAKWQQYPGLFDRRRVIAARTINAFDDAFSAPVHGFKGVDDYWTRASAKPHLARIRIAALVLNPRNDPFVPAASLPAAVAPRSNVVLWQPAHGGHVGFPSDSFPGHLRAMPQAVADWLDAQH